MTKRDEIYADWMNALGSDEADDTDPEIFARLHHLHEDAEASHAEGE